MRVWLTVNQEPTLTISGTALVGQTLTAVIDEPDGLPADDQITYQWIRDDGTTETDISGATDSTYTLVDDDEDKTIKVEVSYTDNANFAESLTSAATATVTTGPSVASVSVGSITRNSATVTVTINNPDSTSQTVYLQYKTDIAGAWTSGGSESTTSTSVEFSLTGLDGNTNYDVQASLDSNFASGVVEEGFKTSAVEPRKLIVGLLSSGDGTLTFIWVPPNNGGSAILDYTVQWKGPGQNYDPSRQATSTVHIYTITGLTNGDEYTARVRARNAVGSGEWDETTGTPSTTPDAPVVVAAPGNEQLTVSWAEPGTGGSDITGYTVQLKDSTVTGWPSASVTEEKLTGTPPATSHTFTGLTNDTAYTVRARATNANGDGDWSGDATGTPVSGPSVATVSFSEIMRTSAKVTVAVANLQGARKTVHLQYKKNSDSAWTDAGSRSTTGTDVEFSLTSLDGNTDYDVRASLEQDFSAGIVEEDFKTGPIEPDPPTGLNILLVSSQTLLVEWTAPMNTGGSAITGYKVQWKSGNQQFGSSRQLLAQHTATSGAVTSLSNGTEYTVRVLAFNNIGDSASSNEVQGTPVGPPEPPASVSAGPGDTRLTVTWSQTNDGGSDITAYRVQLKRSSVTGWPSGSITEAPLTGSPPDTFHTFTGLTNEIAHTVRVKATNTHGDSGWSDEATGTPRSGPAVASVNVKLPIKCTVSWIALEFANLDEATSYQAHLRFRVQGTQSWTVLWPQGFWSSNDPNKAAAGELNGASPTFTLADLDYGATYEVQAALDIRFVDGLATTSFSTPDLSEVGLMPLSPGNNVLGARWHEPTSEGQVTGYLVQWKSGSEEYDGTDTSERQADVPGSGDGEHTITGLDNGVEYTVRVMAYNGNGVGVPSDELKGTPQALPNSPAEGAPTISGTAQVGETLTAETTDIEDADGLSQAAYSYQWLAGDVEIAGATDSNYTLAATDEGKTVKVKVSFTDDANNKEALTSEATAAVEPKANSPARGAPTISGTAQVGETLTAETTDIEDADGMDNASFSYQWLADDLEIAGAADSTYALVDADEGKTIKVRVSFNDDANNQETLTSEPTAAVAANPDAPSEPPNAPRTVRITGDTISSLTLSWVAPGGGGTVAEYRVQWHAIGEGFARARRDGREAVVNASVLTHTITGLSEDEFYMVRVLALNGAGESEGSNLAWGITGAGKSNYGHS